MKVATVKYTGPMQSRNIRGPSGVQYNLQNPMGGSPRAVEVHSVKDGERFERDSSVFEVEWTKQGDFLKRVGGPVTDAKDVLSDIAYNQKRSLVSTFNLDPESQSEEDIDEALKEEVDGLVKQMNANKGKQQ